MRYQDRYILGFGYEAADDRQVEARFVVLGTADSVPEARVKMLEIQHDPTCSKSNVYEIYDQKKDRFSKDFRPTGNGVDFRDLRSE
jgi:hypothetical protein